MRMKIIFVDRDGVINQYPGDREYVKSWEEFSFLPRSKAALKTLNDGGFRIYVISNQAGVSKGIYAQSELDRITAKMLSELGKSGAKIDGVYYCTHRPEENCSCRKPRTGLVEAVLSSLKATGVAVDLSNSYFVGDTIRDICTGKSAGLKTILVFSGKEKPENRNDWELLPDFTARDLLEAAETIIK
jgi:histidinol-phosphate phosphatase family protein